MGVKEQQGTATETAKETARPSGVGALLRATRERLGDELRDVASVLRIRYPYLQAIEDGRYRDLPGPTYAVGFIRTYADYLGLDQAEVVRRFKLETESNPETDLDFPVPTSEGRMPGGALMLIGLLLAGLAYGVWYYLSMSESELESLVSSVAEPAAELPELVTGEPETVPTPDTGDAAPAPAEDASTIAPAEAAPAPESPDAAAAPDEPSSAAPAPGPESAADEETAPEAAAVTPSAEEATAPSADPPPAPPVEAERETVTAAEPPTPAVVAEAPFVAEPDAPHAPTVYGATNTDARIVIKAVERSWIEVKDDNEILISRELQPGDSYKVPNRTGLTMATGNAGGLVVQVEGEAVPPLGDRGEVRHGIQLVPSAMR